MSEQPQQHEYALGDSEAEARRLALQARQRTLQLRRFLEDAGVEPGMKVLDVGSGVGDVAFGAAALVGPSGNVTGVERNQTSVEVATKRATEAGRTNITFVQADLRDNLPVDRDYDAVIGRLVLEYLPDPKATLTMLLGHLKGDGIVGFQEVEARVSRAFMPPAPVLEQCWDWTRRGQLAAGTDMYIGLKLGQLYMDLGLKGIGMRGEFQVLIRTAESDASQTLGILRSLAPVLLREGIATEAELDFDQLDRRLREEAAQPFVAMGGLSTVLAWGRKP